MGAGSSGIASLIHNRRFIGVEIKTEYVQIAKNRIKKAFAGELKIRPILLR